MVFILKNSQVTRRLLQRRKKDEVKRSTATPTFNCLAVAGNCCRFFYHYYYYHLFSEWLKNVFFIHRVSPF